MALEVWSFICRVKYHSALPLFILKRAGPLMVLLFFDHLCIPLSKVTQRSFGLQMIEAKTEQ